MDAALRIGTSGMALTNTSARMNRSGAFATNGWKSPLSSGITMPQARVSPSRNDSCLPKVSGIHDDECSNQHGKAPGRACVGSLEWRGPWPTNSRCWLRYGGDNAVLLAMHGFDVTAFDFHEAAVAVAKQRVAASGKLRGSVQVLHADVFRLTDELGTTQFDTVVDSVVFHCIGDDEVQERYVTILGEHVRQGGHLLLHAASDRNPDPWIGPPRRLSEERARRPFFQRGRVAHRERATLPLL